MGRGRKIALAAATTGVIVAGLVTLALANGSTAPDHDYDLASSKYGDYPPCPEGDTLQVSEWERGAEAIADMQEHAPEGVELGSIPALDFVLVVPEDPRPFIDEIPEGTVFSVTCVEVAPGDLRLFDGDGRLTGEPRGEADA